MGQAQTPHSTKRRIRFPARLTILVLVVAAAVAFYVSRLEKEEPFDVLIHIVGEDVQKVQIVGGTVADALYLAGIGVGPYDRLEPGEDEPLTPDMKIVIERAVPVRIKVDGEEKVHWVIAETVREALRQAGVTLGQLDRVSPSLSSALEPESTIQVVRVEERYEEEMQTLPFKVIRWAAPELERGQTRIVREGQEGIIRNTVRVVYEDGRPVNRTIVNTEVVQPVVDRIIGEGTRTPARTVDTPNGPLPYVDVLVMEATGYEPGPTSTGQWSDGLTFTGLKAQRGVVAVDPNVIPLGTRLYIEGYGEGIAADIGGAIKGNRIDLCFDTYEEAIQWGRRTVKVYILAD